MKKTNDDVWINENDEETCMALAGDYWVCDDVYGDDDDYENLNLEVSEVI